MTAKQVNGPKCVGVAGLGLMGRGIVTCLLGHGLKVIAYNRTYSRAIKARGAIAGMLEDALAREVLKPSHVKDWRDRFRVVKSCKGLASCDFVIETVKENLKLKGQLYDEIESHVSPNTVIASNTSSFPLELLQKKRKHPERFVVMHWAEPAWITRFMEIVRNEKTTDDARRLTERLGRLCDKEPSVMNFDIRGFLANRMMYAFIREACYLVDHGVATVDMIDRSFRNDTGWWSALAGPFRWMDLTGIDAYAAVMEGIHPELADTKTLPEIMKLMRKRGARGISNQNGFYKYTEETAKAWENAWVEFTYDIRKLVKKYENRLDKAGALPEDD